MITNTTSFEIECVFDAPVALTGVSSTAFGPSYSDGYRAMLGRASDGSLIPIPAVGGTVQTLLAVPAIGAACAVWTLVLYLHRRPWGDCAGCERSPSADPHHCSAHAVAISSSGTQSLHPLRAPPGRDRHETPTDSQRRSGAGRARYGLRRGDDGA